MTEEELIGKLVLLHRKMEKLKEDDYKGIAQVFREMADVAEKIGEMNE